jgi:hypothetical protein
MPNVAAEAAAEVEVVAVEEEAVVAGALRRAAT